MVAIRKKNIQKDKKIAAVLFILPNLHGGGAERVVLNVIRRLDRNKFKPILFLFKNEGVYWDEVPNDVSVITAIQPGQRIFVHSIKILYKLIDVSRRSDILVGALELTATYYAAFVGKLLKKPAIGWIHTDLRFYAPAKKRPHKWILKLTYPFLTKAIAVSDGVKDASLEVIPKLKNKICVIYNPFEMERAIELSQTSLELNIDRPIIMGIGRLSYEKGFDILIAAHAILRNRGRKYQLIILGEGQERKSLEETIKRLNLQDSVWLVGFQENPFAWLKHASVFVLSSRFEGFGMVLIEALALGIPCISFDCPSGPSEILGKEYGVMVPSLNAESLANAIDQVMNDISLRDALSKKGPNRAREFAPEVTVPQFERLLLDLL